MRAILATTVALALTLGSAVSTSNAAPPATDWVPQDAVLVVHAAAPGDVVDLVTSEELVAHVSTLPDVKRAFQSDENNELQLAVKYVEAQLGVKWPEALRTVLGGGVTFAVGPGEQAVFIVQSSDEAMLRKLHDIFRGFAEDAASKRGAPDDVKSGDYRGVTGWTFGGKEYHAIIDNRLVLANDVEALKAVIDRIQDDADTGFTSASTYEKAQPSLAGNQDIWMIANMGILTQLPGVQEGLTQRDNPWAVLLAGSLGQQLRRASWLTATLDVQGHKAHLELATDGKLEEDDPIAAFMVPHDSDVGAARPLSVPDQIAVLSSYRDLHSFYAAKDDLFPERTSALIFFENMMGIFFTGRDLTDEVFAEVEPQVRIVVATQEYDSKVGVPQTKLPAFAAVFKMKDPERFATIAEEAWQKAVGLVNFTSGQKAEPGLIIDRPVHNEVKYTVARYAPAPNGTEQSTHTRYNFTPSLASADEYLILSSAEALTRDLLDAVAEEKKQDTASQQGVQDVLRLDVTEIAKALDFNRDAMIQQNMVEKGHTMEEAEKEISTLIAILGMLGKLELTIRSDNGALHADLDAQFELR